jgi:predicted HicB family RNase H-like nuclease
MANLRTKAGTKLSTQRLKRLGEEAERGYDLSSATREHGKPGRPSLAEGESPKISYRIPASLFEAASERAKTEGRTLSEVAREALERYLSG